ncbi:DcaP family trimeric outer membrane transporter [Paraferrimonas haliotis]|uniref:Porin n=1 Tax=Paraferrimonas haliotis TaxID=2013866 RepID=A0AA37WZP1_9GAMM|nr:DcaP family trimeric outer membrane transporter [Paraferrimonas haliotis]GLS84950.1 hypothetical protein GCM10007894_29270 [Paraferrimonas haliotis]
MKSTLTKLSVAISATLLSTSALANFDFDLGNDRSLSFGGYVKADARYVSGDVAYGDQWLGNGTVLAEDASQFRIFANETRLNTKYTDGDVSGFVEMDFFGAGGNEVISNSKGPRLRHAFVSYKGLLAGQTWTTYMNTSAIAETADFGTTMMGISFVRQGQIRYTMGAFQVALENPESYGVNTDASTPKPDPKNDGLPDVIGKYTLNADWGNISISGVARQLNTDDGKSHTTIGGGIAGKINTFGKDDVRFQAHYGELGRYVGTTVAPDLYNGKAETTTAFNVAYRHFWTETMRSTAIYGYGKTDESNRKNTHWAVNVFDNLTPKLAVGFEVGEMNVNDPTQAVNNGKGSSYYGQFSMKYAF